MSKHKHLKSIRLQFRLVEEAARESGVRLSKPNRNSRRYRRYHRRSGPRR